MDCSLLFVIIKQVDDDPRDFTEQMVVENRSDVRKNIEFNQKSQSVAYLASLLKYNSA